MFKPPMSGDFLLIFPSRAKGHFPVALGDKPLLPWKVCSLKTYHFCDDLLYILIDSIHPNLFCPPYLSSEFRTPFSFFLENTKENKLPQSPQWSDTATYRLIY